MKGEILDRPRLETSPLCFHEGSIRASKKGGWDVRTSEGAAIGGHELWLVVTVPTVTISLVPNGAKGGGPESVLEEITA